VCVCVFRGKLKLYLICFVLIQLQFLLCDLIVGYGTMPCRVGQLTELLDVLQDGEHQWVDEQRALMSALDTTQVELWQTCSALASAKKKIRSLQQSTHGNPTSQAEGAQGQDQDTETEQADKFDIDDEYEDEVAKDPRVVSMMDYVGALEEEVMLERQAHAATEARLHYQGAQLDLVTHKLGAPMRWACSTLTNF